MLRFWFALVVAAAAAFQQPTARRRPVTLRRAEEEAPFENPNPLLETAADAIPALAPGRRVAWGVLSGAVDASSLPDAAERP